MSEFVRVARLGEIPKGRGRTFDLDGTKVAIWRVGSRYVAIQDACPHMGASLAGARIEGNRIVCHWHGWSFDLDSGECDARDWASARIFEVRIRGEELFVKRPPDPEPPEEKQDEPLISWDPDRFFKG